MIIKSASAVAFSIGAFALIYLRPRLNLTNVIYTFVFGISLALFVALVLPNIGGRAGDLAAALSQFESIGELAFYLANESGNRLLALYSFLISGVVNPFGSGVGSWPYSSIVAVELSGLHYTEFRFFDVRGDGNLIPFRGPGVISNLFLDIGLIGFLVFIALFYRILKSYGRFNELSRKAFWIFLFKISLFGSPGNPIVFIFFITVFLLNSRLSPKVQNTHLRVLGNGKA